MEESTEFFTEKYIATVFSCPKRLILSIYTLCTQIKMHEFSIEWIGLRIIFLVNDYVWKAQATVNSLCHLNAC
jgi:hypothetical protein